MTFSWRRPLLPQVQSFHIVTVSSKGHVQQYQVKNDDNTQTLSNFIWGEIYRAAIFPEVGSTLEPSEWVVIAIGKFILNEYTEILIKRLSHTNIKLLKYCFLMV